MLYCLDNLGGIIQMIDPNLAHLSVQEKRALLKKMMGEKKHNEIDSIEVFKTEDTKRLDKLLAFYKEIGIDNPYFRYGDGLSGDTISIEGKSYINYASYNYTGCCGAPYVNHAVWQAIEQFGTSSSASRVVSGNKTIHKVLEDKLARNLGVEAALCFVGGYTTNASVISHLMTSEDLILQDSLAHRSLITGSVSSGARRIFFNHNDLSDLEAKLKENRSQYRHCLIIIEGVYSMDGDIADLPGYIVLKNKYKSLLMVDEAHSMGVIGKTGKGLSEYFNLPGSDVDIWMGTLSKAYATCGGYIAGSQLLIDNLKYSCPGFIYSVGLPPPSAAAALASIELIEQEPERIATLKARADLFRNESRRYGLNIGVSHDSAIVPIITGNSTYAIYLSDSLFKQGINAQPIFYPTVEESAARVRFFISCLHSESQIIKTVKIIADIMHAIDSDAVLSEKLRHWESILKA